MTDMPKLIWADAPTVFDDLDCWHSSPHGSDCLAYVRADLIRDAIIAGMRIATNTPITMVPEAIQDAIDEIMGGKND